MNRLEKLFQEKSKSILNIYFTAGFPHLESTSEIIQALDKAKVDLIELGMPYSDPLADGETIQHSSSVAIKNGMQLDLLFEQVKSARNNTQIPIMLMGYYNQVIQYGQAKFLNNCVNAGIDGLIIPDIPMDYYQSKMKSELDAANLKMTFLITPETSEERIKQADELSTAFLYVVAKSSITGNTKDLSREQIDYFSKLNNLNLNSPRLIGFGIHDHASFTEACEYANGAIIGSAFIRQLAKSGTSSIGSFIDGIKNPA